jgi:hypothetical protein
VAVITLADAKAHLNIPTANTTSDSELQGFVDAVTPVVEDIAGFITQRTITNEVHDGGTNLIALKYTPVIAVTSVIEYVGQTAFTLTSQPQSATVDNYGFELVDVNGGILLRRGAAGQPIPFMGGDRAIVVSYTAGMATVPPAVRLGALELVRYWWQRSQQGGRPSFAGSGGPDGGMVVSGSYLVPNFVAELLASTPTSPRRIPGIA